MTTSLPIVIMCRSADAVLYCYTAVVFTKIQVQLLAIQLESCRVEFVAQRHFVAEFTALFCRIVSAIVFREIYSDTGVGLRLFDTTSIILCNQTET